MHALMGKQVKDKTMHTGGPGVCKGKALKKKKGATVAEVMGKMHVVMPVMEGMMLHLHLPDHLLN